MFCLVHSVPSLQGARGWTDIREYVLGHHEWFRRHQLFEKGVPVHDTFARLIAIIEPQAFRQCFLDWMQALHRLTQGEVVAIDGKKKPTGFLQPR